MIATRRAEMVRPRPVPPKRRVVEPSAWLKASKIIVLLVGRDADAGVGDARRARSRFAAGLRQARDAHEHFALVGELDGVADQVERGSGGIGRNVGDQRVGHVGRDVAQQLETLSRAPAAPAASASSSVSRSSRMRSDRDPGCRASIFEKSRMSLTIASSDSAEDLHQSRAIRAVRR